MNKFGVTMLFCGALLLGLVLFFPLAFALRLAGETPLNIRAQTIHGTIWNGYLEAGELGNVAFDRLHLRLKPSSLLRLAPQWRVELKGASVSAQGHLVVASGQWGARHLEARVGLSALQLPKTWQGEVRLSNASWRFVKGLCKSADGRVRTDALALFAKDLGIEATELSGRLNCDAQGRATAHMEGMAQNVPVSLDWTVAGNRRYELRLVIPSVNPALDQILIGAGFSQSDAGLVKSESGRF